MQSLIRETTVRRASCSKSDAGTGKGYAMQVLFALLVASALLPATIRSTHAAVFCTSTAIGLQAALDSAANNGEDDTITVAEGIYTPPTANGFTFYSSEPYSLTIRGGYRYFMGNPCVVVFDSADWTVIDGGGTNALLVASLAPGAGDLSITSMTFRNGVNAIYGNEPVRLGASIGYDGDIALERIVVRGNQATGPSIHAYSEGSVTVRNSAFVDNVVTQAYMSAAIFDSDGTSASAQLTFVGNTAAGNTTQLAGNFARIKLWAKSGTLDVYNNVFCGNADHDLQINMGSGVTATVAHNDICSRGAWGGVITEVANLSVDPRFVGAGDYHLRGDSPLRDSGDNNPPGGTGSVDVGGMPRVVLGTVDIGAYEFQDYGLFADGFE